MKIRVLFPFSGHIVGGSHISTLTLIQHLPEHIEPVIGIFSEGALTKYLDDHQIPWIIIPGFQPAINNQSLAWEIFQLTYGALPLRRFLKCEKIDIIHTQEYNMHCLWALAKVGTHTKHIWHQRSLNPSRRLALYQPFVDYYLTISQFCRDHLPPVIQQRTEIVPNPVYIPASALAEKADLEYLAAPHSFKIGFVGHLDKQKRIMIFLDIARHLDADQAYQNVHFFIFGDAAAAAAQHAHAFIEKHTLNKRCHIMGTKFPISPWIRELDLLIAPAAHEGLGRSIIEAQILGVPVLASKDGGHKELIKDHLTGYFATLDDTDDFVEKVKSIIQNYGKAKETSAFARAAAEEKFSVAAHVDRIVQIYQSLASAKP